MKSLVAVCIVLFVSHALAKQLPNTPSLYALDPARLPINVAVLEGATVDIQCAVADPEVSHSVQWVEFAHTPNGGPISDNEIIGNHPEAARYQIIHGDAAEYTLRISPVILADGGVYLCQDAQANPATDKRQHSASLTVIAQEINCTTTIRDSGIVLDLSYNTNDCILPYKGALIPNMTWSGIGPFNQAYVSTPENVWSGMAFNVTRQMDTAAHQCTTYFTSYFTPPANTATNVPTFNRVFQNRQMFVYWGPTGVTAEPIKPTYDAGDLLVCSSDAFPPASYLWQNMRTNQITAGNTVRIDEQWRGFNQSMRCEARNTIEGTIYSSNLFIAVDVNPLTTPSTTTPPTTTTLPPAVSDCLDLTGPWQSVSPTPASLCIRLDLVNNGLLTGLLKNASDTYWVDIIGRAQSNKFDQVGFNGIWPADIGVSSFIGECHRCFGEERLLVNVVSKSRGSPCGTSGEVRYTTQYVFYRASQTLQCPNLPN